MSNCLGRQALVIGAGMSGLAAAGALAQHFEQVTVVERDGLADDPCYRAGTPHCRQLHGLLSGGLEALCGIFPGFDQDLAAAGAAPGPTPRAARSLSFSPLHFSLTLSCPTRSNARR